MKIRSISTRRTGVNQLVIYINTRLPGERAFYATAFAKDNEISSSTEIELTRTQFDSILELRRYALGQFNLAPVRK